MKRITDLSVVSRFNRRSVIYGLVIVWILMINLWVYNYNSFTGSTKAETIHSIYDEEYSSEAQIKADAKVNVEKLDLPNDSQVKDVVKKLGIKDQRSIDSHSTNYDLLFKNHKIGEVLSDLNFNQRCDLYFQNLFIHDDNWSLDPNVDLPLDHRHEFDPEDFQNNVKGRVKEQLAESLGEEYNKINFNDQKISEEIDKLIQEEYDNFWKKTMDVEQKITDYLSHLRIFNKCYITHDVQHEIDSANKLIGKERLKIKHEMFKHTPNEKLLGTKSFKSCNEIESRVYKWLSFSYPIFERWTGDKLLTPPIMKNYVKYPEVFKPTNSRFTSTTGETIKSEFTGDSPCFLNKFKNQLNGKGIVLSINDKHVDDTVKLIHLLRALNNHYPIQIVYYDSLSIESKTKIVNAASNKLMDLPQSFQQVAKYFPDDYMNAKDGGLPRQEVWFVNTYNTIHQNYKDKFKGFANKFLATLFNSFEEFMLIDADTVLVQNPEFFFKLKNYVNKGAYFYKDRTAPEFRPLSDAKFFEKITPSIVDNLMFDIPIVTRHTLGLEFFQGMGHYMESGLVMINRHLHFNSILTMIQLNFFNPVTTRVYGDKEIFWLGFAATGDESYHFNKYFTASIGTMTPQEDRLNSQGKPKLSREICSAHPGHINGEDNKSLVWFNSGFKFCGQSDRVDYEKEAEKQERLKFLKTPDEMRNYYENPIQLQHAIIPPFKNKMETWCENTIDEPKQGWHMDKGYCNSYLWCAYSSIGGITSGGDDNMQVGKIFEFDQKSVDLFKYYGDVWVGNE